MTELTDRYVTAALRTIPEKHRDDIESELRASIGDAIDARVDNGEEMASAERAILTELGDPDRLASSYTGAPGYLIGPDLYFDYRRLLTVLLITVVPVSMVVVGLLKGLGDGFASALGAILNTGIQVALHVGFWTTVGFAIVERSSEKDAATPKWTLNSLPHLPTAGTIKFSETIASIVVLGMTMMAIVVQRDASPFTSESGEPIPVLEPSLWSSWLPVLLVVLAAEIIFELVKYKAGLWTRGLASANLVVGLLAAAPLIYLLITGQLLNPEFFDELGWPSGPLADSSLTSWTVSVIVFVTSWDIFYGFRHAARTSPRHGLATRG